MLIPPTKTKYFSTRGFTILELLVSLTIMSLLTAIVVFNQSDFADQTALSNSANDLELALREVQTYGTSGRFDDPGSWSCGNECLRLSAITRGNRIVDMCAVLNNAPTACVAGGAIGRVDITFLRPNPAAKILFRNSSGTSVAPNHDGAKIFLKSPRGNQKTVTIYTTGQISVQ
jgi:prepilin-type N-terminal cleavage/methylation domain-containing protein